MPTRLLGQFILTSSVRAELANETWAGTGRVVRMHMYGLTGRELTGDVDVARGAFLDRLASTGIDDLVTRDAATVGGAKDPTKLRSYLAALALNNAGVARDNTLYQAAGIESTQDRR